MHVNQHAVRKARIELERRADLYDAIEAVFTAAAAPVAAEDGDWRRDLRWALASLAEAFHDHRIVSEEPGGTLEQISREAPRLIERERELIKEHEAIAVDIHRLIDQIDASTKASCDGLKQRAFRLAGEVARHRRASSDLFLEAYEVDIGELGD